MNLRTLAVASLLGAVPATAFGQNFDSGSDGSDGALTFAANQGTVEFDPAALGINNADRIYHFTTITVGAGTTVRLSAKTLGEGRAITWLASGAVSIAGTLDLDGRPGHVADSPPLPSEAGAGGWSGGKGRTSLARATGGNGPGGGLVQSGARGGNAGHAFVGQDTGAGGSGPAYGNTLLLPLTGGSGGAGGDNAPGHAGGGAGGGALLIASSVSITVTGSINARGGNGSNSGKNTGGAGSGGGIRLIAPTLSGAGNLRVNGGSGFNSGSAGRVRLEAFTHNLTSVTPLSVATFARPGVVLLPANAPKLSVPSVTTSTGTVNVAANPQGSFEMPDVVVNTNQPITLNLAAQNIPVGTQLSIRVVPEGGAPITLTSTALSGTTANSTATAGPLTIPTGYTRFSITASFNP